MRTETFPSLVRVPRRLRFRLWLQRRRLTPAQRRLSDDFALELERRMLGL